MLDGCLLTKRLNPSYLCEGLRRRSCRAAIQDSQDRRRKDKDYFPQTQCARLQRNRVEPVNGIVEIMLVTRNALPDIHRTIHQPFGWCVFNVNRG